MLRCCAWAMPGFRKASNSGAAPLRSDSSPHTSCCRSWPCSLARCRETETRKKESSPNSKGEPILSNNRDVVRLALKAGGGTAPEIIRWCVDHGADMKAMEVGSHLSALKAQNECEFHKEGGWKPKPGLQDPEAPRDERRDPVLPKVSEALAISESEGKHEAEEVAAAERD